MIGDDLAVYFENPARDALGYEHVSGCLRFTEDFVELHFDEKDRAFRKTPPQTVRFSYGEVLQVVFRSRWLRPKTLAFETSAPEKLAGFPGAAVGRVELTVTPASLPAARKAPAWLEYKRSEARLAESTSRLRQQKGGLETGLP